MSQATDRLRRLLEDELGECRDDDLEDRLAALDDLQESTPLDRAAADAHVFGALASETRYKLARFLVASTDDLCVCELTPMVDVSDSAVSHALSELVEAGLATRRKEGRWHYYDATERLEAVLDAFDATETEAYV